MKHQIVETEKEDNHRVTVLEAFKDSCISFHQEEQSGLDTIQPTKLANLAFGEVVANGIIISNSTSKPQLHLLKASFLETLRSFNNNTSKLTDAIDAKQGIEAFTPSKDALRVLSILIATNLSGKNEKAFKALIDKARKLNLIEPQDKEWSEDIVINLNGVDMKATIGLKKIDLLTRSVMQRSKDLSSEAKKNIYGYKVDIEVVKKRDTEALIKCRNLFNRLTANSTMIAPLAAGAVVLKAVLPSNIIPKVFENNILQTILEKGYEAMPVILSAITVYKIQQYMTRYRALKKD